MAFRYYDNLLSGSGPALVSEIINNSVAIEPGDAVRTYNAGYVALATEANAIKGIVHAVLDDLGRSLAPERDTQAELGDATIASGVVTVGGDNTTDDAHRALIDISPFSRYSADVTGTIGTTNSSNLPGANIDADDENTIDETTAVRTASGQFYGWGTDPNDSGNIIVSIRESEIFGSTAVYG